MSSAFELKSAALTLVALMLKTTDLGELSQALDERFAEAPGLFDGDPVAVDLSGVRDADAPIDFAALVELLRGHGMLPVAAKAGSDAQMEAARAAGLVEAHGPGPAARSEPVPAQPGGPDAGAAGEPAGATAAGGEAPADGSEPDTVPGSLDMPAPPRSALIIDRPLRSGQRAYAKGADLVVLAAVSFGAEVIADGNIHVYGPLRGRALAGALGDTGARIFTTCMEPQLLSIAGIYRTTENELPADVLGRPAQVRLDGEKLVVEALKN